MISQDICFSIKYKKLGKYLVKSFEIQLQKDFESIVEPAQ